MRQHQTRHISPFLENLLRRQLRVDGSASSMKALAGRVRELSDRYGSTTSGPGQPAKLGRELSEAYALYYLPVNLVKLFPVLDEMEGLQLFSRETLSVLDLGCGPGTFSLGLLEYLAAGQERRLHTVRSVMLRGMDSSADMAAVAERLVRGYLAGGALKSPAAWDISFRQGLLDSRAALRGLVPEHETFDLILAGNVLSELGERGAASVTALLKNRLSKKGAAIVIEPGTREAFRNLLGFRGRVAAETGLRLYGPCPKEGTCPLQEDAGAWCHEKIFWSAPEIVSDIDRHTGFTKHKGLKYCYCTFAGEDTCFEPVREKGGCWRVVSYVIKSKGQETLHLCDGTRRIIARRLKRNASKNNADFSASARGDYVLLEAGSEQKQFVDVLKETVFRTVRKRV